MARSKDRKLQHREVRKEKRKHLNIEPDFEVEREPQDNNAFKCPKCKSPLHVIEGARRSVFVCTGCDYRASRITHGKAV